LISKMGYGFTTPWIVLKIVIWLALGGLIALINRKPQFATGLWWLLVFLGLLGAIMVYARPFS